MMQQEQPHNLLLSQVFMFLRPLSPDATKALRQLCNNDVLAETVPPGCRVPLIGLNFRILLGRCCISFGSSRCREVLFPKGCEVDPLHFKIHLETNTGTLLLTDTSTTGTWISCGAHSNSRLLKRDTYPLLENSTIEFGRNRSYRFRVTVTDYKKDILGFHDSFERYAKSIWGPEPGPLTGLDTITRRMPISEERYVPLHQLAAGQYGEISTCIRVTDGRLFACKTVRVPTGSEDNRASALALRCHEREVKILRRLEHPNIVRFIDQTHIFGCDALVIEILPRGTLADMLDTISPCSLETTAVKTLTRQCLDAVRYLNSHDIIHHDIKPQNILICREEPISVKLCDFGAADDAVSILSTRLFIGTRFYMAPEFGTKQHSFGVDVWALGIVVMNVSGFWPWEPVTVSGRIESLPDYSHLSCASLLDQMLNRDRKRRATPQSCLSHDWLYQGTKRRRSSLLEVGCTPPTKQPRIMVEGLSELPARSSNTQASSVDQPSSTTVFHTAQEHVRSQASSTSVYYTAQEHVREVPPASYD